MKLPDVAAPRMRENRKTIGLWLLGAFAAAMGPNADAVTNQLGRLAPTLDPRALYGEEIYFDVYRKGEKVGFHRVRFSGNAQDLTVRSEFKLQIDIFFLTAFRYLYRSDGRWRQGQLEGLKVSVDDDGKPFALDVVRDGKHMKIESPGDAFTTDAPLFPTNHWNAGVLAQSRVLNTLTGRLNQVRIEPIARETVATERGGVPATRYAYSGELETEVWYDDAGRWVKMRFAGRDGTTIEYVCRRCQGAQATKVKK